MTVIFARSTTILTKFEFMKIIFNVCYCHLKFEKGQARNHLSSNDYFCDDKKIIFNYALKEYNFYFYFYCIVILPNFVISNFLYKETFHTFHTFNSQKVIFEEIVLFTSHDHEYSSNSLCAKSMTNEYLTSKRPHLASHKRYYSNSIPLCYAR